MNKKLVLNFHRSKENMDIHCPGLVLPTGITTNLYDNEYLLGGQATHPEIYETQLGQSYELLGGICICHFLWARFSRMPLVSLFLGLSD